MLAEQKGNGAIDFNPTIHCLSFPLPCARHTSTLTSPSILGIPIGPPGLLIYTADVSCLLLGTCQACLPSLPELTPHIPFVSFCWGALCVVYVFVFSAKSQKACL